MYIYIYIYIGRETYTHTHTYIFIYKGTCVSRCAQRRCSYNLLLVLSSGLCLCWLPLSVERHLGNTGILGIPLLALLSNIQARHLRLPVRTATLQLLEGRERVPVPRATPATQITPPTDRALAKVPPAAKIKAKLSNMYVCTCIR